MKKRLFIYLTLIVVCLVISINNVKAKSIEPCVEEAFISEKNASEWDKTACFYSEEDKKELKKTDINKLKKNANTVSTFVCEYNLTAYGNNVYIRIWNPDSDPKNETSKGTLDACIILQDGEQLIYQKNFESLDFSNWIDDEDIEEDDYIEDYWGGVTDNKRDVYDLSKKILNQRIFWRNVSLGDYDYVYSIVIGPRSGIPHSQSDCPTVSLVVDADESISAWKGKGSCIKNEEPSSSIQEEPSSTKTTQNDDLSYKGKEIKIMYIVGMALLIIRIIVPLLLIVTGMIGLIKSMTKSDDRDIKAELKKLAPKLIAAIIIFILPTLVALLMRLTNKTSLWNDYSKCLLTPTKCNVKLWED